MDRREWLGLMTGAIAAPWSDEVRAAGRALHRRAARGGAARLLDHRQRATVAAVAELILPETDTPGAGAVGVPAFIDLVLAEWYDEEGRARFLAGLADLDAQAQRRHGTDFVGAPPTAQADILRELDQALAAERETARTGSLDTSGRWAGGAPTVERSFFYQMKRLTLLGYYTSEVGATQEVHYQIIPGRYDGCVPLERGGE